MFLKSKTTISYVLIGAFASFALSCRDESAKRISVGATIGAEAPPVVRMLPPLPARPLSPKLEAMRARAMNTAGNLRELAWTNEVGMAELSAWEYGTRTREMTELLGGDDLRALSHLAVSGGVLPKGTDLASLAASFTALSAGATYSPLDKQILLVDKTSGDSILTHEFVHALQDQHFDLLKMLDVRPYNFDRTEAAFAVIEGDAMNVQRRAEETDEVYARRPLDDIARQESERFNEYRKEIGQIFPPLLTETFIFRYRDGARFVEAVRRRGGERAVDNLFLHPPASSEQILHPEKYFANELPRRAELNEESFAAEGWHMTASTPLGEIGIRGLLMNGVSERDAVRAAAGWGGDCAYLFERARHAPLFIWRTVWDKREDAQEFYHAYNDVQRRNAAPADTALSPRGELAMAWREGELLTLVRLHGDTVLILRGTEEDIAQAIQLISS